MTKTGSSHGRAAILPTHLRHTLREVADLFADYRLGAAWDEMIDASGNARPPYRTLYESMQNAGVEELRASVDSLARAYLNQGVTFDVGGEERPFPLDIVPRVIDDASWQVIEGGVRQRVRALEAFLADVYGPARVVDDGVVPRRVITSSKSVPQVRKDWITAGCLFRSLENWPKSAGSPVSEVPQ